VDQATCLVHFERQSMRPDHLALGSLVVFVRGRAVDEGATGVHRQAFLPDQATGSQKEADLRTGVDRSTSHALTLATTPDPPALVAAGLPLILL
jgi:hypothetical protein